METPAVGGTSTQRGTLGRLADPGVLASVFLLVIGSYAALSVDVVRTGLGIKGDEATYIAMALSAAYDGDLSYEAEDIDRFYQIYNAGPEGIFLKRGSDGSYRFDGVFPFLHRDTEPDDRSDRLYFGKAYVYSVAAAPFVWVAGLNGLLLFHVFLLAVVVFAGYRFLAAHSPGGLAAGYALGFFGASIVPLYGVWLTSELFNVACVFLAYFLWFYKEVAPAGRGSSCGLAQESCLGHRGGRAAWNCHILETTERYPGPSTAGPRALAAATPRRVSRRSGLRVGCGRRIRSQRGDQR